jgi:hypothetical protein
MFQFDLIAVRSIAAIRSVSFAGYHHRATDNMMPEFISSSTWTNGWAESGCIADNTRVELFNERTRLLQPGDFLITKKLNGRGANTMTLLAIGIVIGRKNDATVYVAWVLPRLELVVPLKEVGTISCQYTLEDIRAQLPTLVQHLELARDIFLSTNLSTVPRTY